MRAPQNKPGGVDGLNLQHRAIIADIAARAPIEGSVDAIEQPHPVANGERQLIGGGILVAGVEHDLVGRKLAGGAPELADFGANRPRIGVGRRAHRQRIVGIMRVGLPALLPQRRRMLDRLAISARNQPRRLIGALQRQRLGGAALAKHQRRFALALALLPDRGQDFGDRLRPERAAQKIDERAGLDRLTLFWIADRDQLKAALFLQPHQLQKLPGA